MNNHIQSKIDEEAKYIQQNLQTIINYINNNLPFSYIHSACTITNEGYKPYDIELTYTGDTVNRVLIECKVRTNPKVLQYQNLYLETLKDDRMYKEDSGSTRYYLNFLVDGIYITDITDGNYPIASKHLPQTNNYREWITKQVYEIPKDRFTKLNYIMV